MNMKYLEATNKMIKSIRNDEPKITNLATTKKQSVPLKIWNVHTPYTFTFTQSYSYIYATKNLCKFHLTFMHLYLKINSIKWRMKS